MDRLAALFEPLARVVTVEPVTLAGAWEKTTTEAVVDCVWTGTFASASPLVGIVLVATSERVDWAKSVPPSRAAAEVAVSLLGWTRQARAASVAVSFQGATVPTAFATRDEEPPAGVTLGPPRGETGRVHVVAEVGDVTAAVLLLSIGDVQVGRNRLWHLRAPLAERLSGPLEQLLTQRRSGGFRGDLGG